LEKARVGEKAEGTLTGLCCRKNEKNTKGTSRGLWFGRKGNSRNKKEGPGLMGGGREIESFPAHLGKRIFKKKSGCGRGRKKRGTGRRKKKKHGGTSPQKTGFQKII